MKDKDNTNERIQVAKVEKTVKSIKPSPKKTATKQVGWFNGKKTIPINKMSDKYLQNAKLHAQKQELYYFNRADMFGELVDALEADAERRGIKLEDFDSEYHKNRRVLKDSTGK